MICVTSRIEWLVASETPTHPSSNFMRIFPISKVLELSTTFAKFPIFCNGKNSFRKFLDLDPDVFQNLLVVSLLCLN